MWNLFVNKREEEEEEESKYNRYDTWKSFIS